jgi:hypothetical protein
VADVLHLAEEVCSGAEIYYTARTGGQYFKTSYILCDDYTELASKLFLTQSATGWTDQRSSGGFKSYGLVLDEALAEVKRVRGSAEVTVGEIHERMKKRRKTRNGFFHSADLLELSLPQRACAESFCDLFHYCGLLFESEWDSAIAGARNLETLILLFELEKLGLSDPSVDNQVNDVLRTWARNGSTKGKEGVQEAQFPEDLHLRLCVLNGSSLLRDRLQDLLRTVPQ